jgi:hypothetical protein
MAIHGARFFSDLILFFFWDLLLCEAENLLVSYL